MATGELQAAVRAETTQAVADGISATPTIIVNGTAYTGALTLRAAGEL